ncbi:hypothetical protein [Natronorarus salvus]|uniref:hypothetical protein n=1 Tax=Natronorarus salvus TaxID=3117733 RepID=UPI002F2600B5
MIDVSDIGLSDPHEAGERRDELVAEVTDHAGRMAHGLALLQGGDYGDRTFQTEVGEWTLKYEGGAVQYLRFDPRSGESVYVVSTKQPPEPAALARALSDYDAFVAAYNEYVDSLSGLLDEIRGEFPEPASTEAVAAERDRIVDGIEETSDAIAGQLHRLDGSEYETFTVRVSGTRWELKREGDVTAYLRIGGDGGAYLLSQYGPPSVEVVREHAGEFAGFVDAYNEYVADLDVSLSKIDLGT